MNKLKVGFSVVWPFLGKSLLWVFWNAFFGLGVFVPILVEIAIVKNKLFPHQLSIPELITKIYEEGIVMFFCNALIAAAAYDAITFKEKPSTIAKILISLLVLVLFFITCQIFGIVYLFGIESINLHTVYFYQLFLICISLVFCLFIKTYLYYYEK